MIWAIFLLFPIFKLVHSQDLPYFDANTNCSNSQARYSTNSPFHQNLKFVLGTLTFAASKTKSRFHSSTIGHDKDTVYGLYLCRGDQTPSKCSLCIGKATQHILIECPNVKEAIIWADECMLRYANRNIFSKEEEDPVFLEAIYMALPPPEGASLSPPPPPPPPIARPFNVSEVLIDLINQTAFTERLFYVRQDNFTEDWSEQVLYSLAQCTVDLTALQCHKCLTQAYNNVLASGVSYITTIAHLPSCHLRFGVRQFFDTKLSRPARLPPASPPSSTILPSENGSGDNKQGGSSYIPIAIAAPFVLATLLLTGLCFFLCKRQPQPVSSNEIITMESLQYDIATIKAATNNFSTANQLGDGGLGLVYKGILQNGEEIAVKRLTQISRQGMEEFKKEVLFLAKLQHKNLVKILGYCVAKEERWLVYEFLPNSSLNELFDAQNHIFLSWETRYKIIEGIAKGMLYLHEYSGYKIVHRDLKPSNILLDNDMTPKISNFGMANLFDEDQVQGSNAQFFRTRGPEYIRSEFSIKSDVYSFGVLVLEIISGKIIRNDNISSAEEARLLQNVWRIRITHEPLTFLDSKLSGIFSAEEALRCIRIGLSCIQENIENRPTMAFIVSLLNNSSNHLPELTVDGHDHLDRNISSTVPVQSAHTFSGMQDTSVLSAR